MIIDTIKNWFSSPPTPEELKENREKETLRENQRAISQQQRADKIIKECKEVESEVMSLDNKDKVDLNSKEGQVELENAQIKKIMEEAKGKPCWVIDENSKDWRLQGANEKFTGKMTYNKDTKEAEDTHITKDCTDNNGRSIVKYKYDKYQLKNGNTLYIKEETTKGIYDSFYKKQERICVDQNGKLVEKPERITEDDYPRVLISNTSIKW